MHTQEVLAQNVRFCLWEAGVPRGQWVVHLVGRLGTSASTAQVQELLDRGEAEPQLVGALAGLFGLPEDELRWQDLVEASSTDILLESLKFLINGMERGGKKALAQALSVDPTTVSRWLSGSFHPHNTTLKEIVRYFGLPRGYDLSQQPIFLSLRPVSITERRAWLRRRIDEMENEELRELFPALERIFGGS